MRFLISLTLKEIKGINNFNTINVNNMSVMFHNCPELEYLDLSNFGKFRNFKGVLLREGYYSIKYCRYSCY